MRLKRETYLEQIRPYYESDIIKVITGVRRCGKSVLLETIKDELVEKGVPGDNIIYLNLEDMDYEYIVDASDLNQEIKSRLTHKGKYYIFLDEIQHVIFQSNIGCISVCNRQQLYFIVGRTGNPPDRPDCGV